MITKLYVSLCNRVVLKSQQMNGSVVALLIAIIIAVLAFFTVTSPKFHGIHIKHH